MMKLSASINEAVSLSLFTLRPLMITFAPILEQVMAMPLPIPEEAPVTNIVLPLRVKGLYTSITLKQ